MTLSECGQLERRAEGASLLRDILVLGKARICLMAILTGYAAIAMEAGRLPVSGAVCACLLALFCMGMGANTLNQIFERGRDARMLRTRNKRPLPSGRMSVGVACGLAAGFLLSSLGILWFVHGSIWAVALAVFTVLYYGFFYTLVLKPRTYLSIVIGGVPGAMGPPIAWAALSNQFSWTPVWLFLIIFLWTPPHVWALAIHLKDDYARAGIPMLPVVKGVEETTRQVFLYSLVMFAGTLLIALTCQDFQGSWVFLSTSTLLGIWFLGMAWRLWKARPRPRSLRLFYFSLVHIGGLFLALIADVLVNAG